MNLPSENDFFMIFTDVQLIQKQHNNERPIYDGEFKIKNYLPLMDILEYGIPGRNKIDYFEQVAYVLKDIIKQNYLSDGNKRFGFYFCDFIMRLNNFKCIVTESQKINFGLDIASREDIKLEHIANKLKKMYVE